jgi:hypothetical protein
MKKNIPNICPHSGISYDYRLAFGSLTNYLERVSEGDPARTRHLAKRTFLHRHIPKYEEYFDSREYDNVINDQNHALIEQLNGIVEELNELRTQEIVDFDVLNALRMKLLGLIKGNV